MPSDTGPIDHFWAVIPRAVPAPGCGRCPACRCPFLHDLTGTGRTLRGHLDRLVPLAAERVVVVTGAARDAVRGQLPEVDADWVLAEPSPARLDGRDRPGRRAPGAPRPRRGDGPSPPTT